MSNIYAGADIIDVRDVIERIEELREDTVGASFPDELATLEALMSDLAGQGGDEKWEDVWYPVILIHESYFTDYAKELAEDCGMVNSDASWPNSFIDWDAAADALKGDYTSFTYGGETYWTR